MANNEDMRFTAPSALALVVLLSYLIAPMWRLPKVKEDEVERKPLVSLEAAVGDSLNRGIAELLLDEPLPEDFTLRDDVLAKFKEEQWNQDQTHKRMSQNMLQNIIYLKYGVTPNREGYYGLRLAVKEAINQLWKNKYYPNFLAAVAHFVYGVGALKEDMLCDGTTYYRLRRERFRSITDACMKLPAEYGFAPLQKPRPTSKTQ